MKQSAYAITGALSAVMLLTACSGGDDGDESTLRQEITANTEINEAEGLEGLASFNLAEQGNLTWDSRSFADGIFTYTGLVFTPEDGEPEDVLNIAELKIAAPRVSENGDVLIDSLEASGFSASDEDGLFGLDRVLIDRPGPGLSAMLADMLNGRMGDDYQVQSDDPADYFFNAISFGGLTYSGTDEGEPVEFSMSEMTFNQYDEAGVAGIIMTGLSLRGEDSESGPINFGLEEFRIEGLNGELMEAMYELSASSEDPEALNRLSDWMSPIGVYESFVMRALDVEVGGLAISMPELTASFDERGDEVVSTSTMPSLRIVAGDGPVGEQMAGGLAMLGYDEITLSMETNAIYEPVDDRYYTTGENYIEVADGFRLSFEQDMSGYQAYAEQYAALLSDAYQAGLEGDEARLQELEDPFSGANAYGALTINSFTMNLEDMSLLERALTAAATQQGVSVEALRVQAAGFLGMAALMAPPEVPQALIAEMTGALSSFIQQGGTFSVSMTPAEPVSVEDFIQQAEAGSLDIEAMGITATHEAP